MVDKEIIDEFFKGIFASGQCCLSTGVRGGGKTHSAISFIQTLMEGGYEKCPRNVVLITNVIFVKKEDDGSLSTESPEGVYTIHTMREIFPIVLDTLEKYGRKDTLIVLLLDEAQNFLLGDLNSRGDMASSMKSFLGIIRKFNMMCWFLTPTARNLGPSFRGFIDQDTEAGNITCTFEKRNRESEAFIRRKKLVLDPRSIIYVKPGFHEKTKMMLVPSVKWTRSPDSIKPGEYVYDHLSSADFSVEDFPFHDFVQYISGKSSYEMVEGIREFYDKLERGEDVGIEPAMRERIRNERDIEITANCTGKTIAEISEILGKTKSQVETLKKKAQKLVDSRQAARGETAPPDE